MSEKDVVYKVALEGDLSGLLKELKAEGEEQ